MSQTDPTDYFGFEVPFMHALGLIPETIDTHFCRTRLPARPDLANSRGDVHGGTLMSVLDFTLSAAARGHAPATTGVATIDLSTHFMDAARGEVIIEATCLRRGRSIAYCEGRVLDAETAQCLVVAHGAFKLLERRSQGG